MENTATGATKIRDLAYELTVGEVMGQSMIAVSSDSTMLEARELLRAYEACGIPVADNGRFLGVVRHKDLIDAAEVGALDACVSERMTTEQVTLFSDERLAYAVGRCGKHPCGRFPVVTRDGKLVGVVTQGDIARAMLTRLEGEYHQVELERYNAGHVFQDIVADDAALVFGYRIPAGLYEQAGAASSKLKRSLARMGIDPRIVRRVGVAALEAEMNIVIFTDGGELVAEVRPDSIRLEAVDKGPGIPDIAQAMKPGFSTAPEWVLELGFGAGMGLPNIKNCADEMSLESTVGVGTHLKVMIHT